MQQIMVFFFAVFKSVSRTDYFANLNSAKQ